MKLRQHLDSSADEPTPPACRNATPKPDYPNPAIRQLVALQKLAAIVRDAVEAGAVDEIYLTLLRDALDGLDGAQ